MTSVPGTKAGSTSRLGRAVRALRGSLFFIFWIPYLLIVAGPFQRFIIWPIVLIVPTWRAPLAGRWLRLQGRIVLWLARLTAGVRVTVRGTLPDEPIVVVMNHQSVLDIPVALTLFHGPGPMFPTRDRYQWYIPVVSPICRMLKFPFITQRPATLDQDLAALATAADRVAAGEISLLIYAEGHRSRDGQIGPFMRRGPRLILSQAKRPVYTVVADGMWGARTFTDALVRLAGSRIRVTVHGPFTPPSPDDSSEFLDRLQETMVASLAELRSEPSR
jgi:1-acyl-sn-glycerol-3-phosphate acyltransferase